MRAVQADLLYEKQSRLRDQDLLAYADKLGLDVERFDKEPPLRAARPSADRTSGMGENDRRTPCTKMVTP